ncbi:MAG: ATPase [Cyanobacteria bacterium SIG29]|nr:ATPase [Cyanobacteria bacterium SIG29]
MANIVLDAGTTWSKIIEKTSSNLMKEFSQYLLKTENGLNYYVLPSSSLKNINFKFDKATGHMSLSMLNDKKDYENEVIALIQGFRKQIEEDSIILDMGSRDSKWATFKDGKFKDLDWNNNCSSSTGATIEMLLKFYNVDVKELKVSDEKYVITCGIFGLEKIMDDIAKGSDANSAISKFIHGIAFNAWNFAKKPSKIYLSGGFCENECFVQSLAKYCEVIPMGRFLLCEGLL